MALVPAAAWQVKMLPSRAEALLVVDGNQAMLAGGVHSNCTECVYV